MTGDFHGQAFGAQTFLAARDARRWRHVLREPLAVVIRVRIFEVSPEHRENSGEAESRRWFCFAAAFRRGAIGGTVSLRRRITVENQALHAARKFLEGRSQIESVRVRREFDCAAHVAGTRSGAETALEKRPRPIRNHFRGIEIVARTEAVADGAGAVRRIETERARFQLRHGDAAIAARQFLGVNFLGAADDGNGHKTFGEFQRRGQRLFQAPGDAGFHEQAIDDNFDRVIFALIEFRRVVERIQRAVDARAQETIARQLFQFLFVFAFAAARQRRHDHHAVAGLGEFSAQDGLHDLLGGLARDGLAAIRAVRHANRAIHHAQEIGNLGDRADGGTRRARGGFLLDGDRRGKALDRIHVGPFHLIEELPRVGR